MVGADDAMTTRELVDTVGALRAALEAEAAEHAASMQSAVLPNHA